MGARNTEEMLEAAQQQCARLEKQIVAERDGFANRLTALVNLLFPAEITPTAKRQLEQVADTYRPDRKSQDSTTGATS